MPIVYACIQPHSGNSNPDAPKTAAAVGSVMRELGSYEPELIIGLVAPPMLRAAIGVSGDEHLSARIEAEAKKDAIPVEVSRHRIDSRLAPLLKDGVKTSDGLWISAARLDVRFHFEFGRALGRAVDADERRAAVVCIAELSRTRDARAGRMFDDRYRRAIEAWDVKWLVGVDTETRRRAGERCIAQTAVLMGALSGYRIQPRVVSYEDAAEGTYLVAAIDVLGRRREAKT